MPMENETILQPQKVGHSMPFMTSNMLAGLSEDKKNSDLGHQAMGRHSRGLPRGQRVLALVLFGGAHFA